MEAMAERERRSVQVHGCRVWWRAQDGWEAATVQQQLLALRRTKVPLLGIVSIMIIVISVSTSSSITISSSNMSSSITRARAASSANKHSSRMSPIDCVKSGTPDGGWVWQA